MTAGELKELIRFYDDNDMLGYIPTHKTIKDLTVEEVMGFKQGCIPMESWRVVVFGPIEHNNGQCS